MVAEGRTVDGFERQFGTNHLGHFALTNLLLPQVTDRVVTVSSGLHKGTQVDFDDLQLASGSYKPDPRLPAVQAGQPAVHRRAPAPADRRRLDGAGDGRAPRLLRHQPAVPPRRTR